MAVIWSKDRFGQRWKLFSRKPLHTSIGHSMLNLVLRWLTPRRTRSPGLEKGRSSTAPPDRPVSRVRIGGDAISNKPAQESGQLNVVGSIRSVGGVVTSTIHVLIVTPVIFYIMKTRALRAGRLQMSKMQR